MELCSGNLKPTEDQSSQRVKKKKKKKKTQVAPLVREELHADVRFCFPGGITCVWSGNRHGD